jgi:hypothetical protein
MPKIEQGIEGAATPGIEPEPRHPAGHGSLWTAKDVAGYLRASPSWVYQKSEAGLLPCLPPLPGSNFLRFDPAAIKAYARGEWRPATATPVRSNASGKASVVLQGEHGSRRRAQSTVPASLTEGGPPPA